MALLLLDLDDTLVSRRKVFMSWARDYAAQYPNDPDLPSWLAEQDADGLRSRQDFWQDVRDRLELTQPVSVLRDQWPAVFGARYRLDPSTRLALTRARAAGWRIGVVTNGGVAGQEAKIAATGLSALVDGICISDREGVAKPDHRIFERAAALCECTLSDGWMIGDNPELDIQGAHGAGLRSVWIAPRGREWPAELPPPTLRAPTVSEAVERAT